MNVLRIAPFRPTVAVAVAATLVATLVATRAAAQPRPPHDYPTAERVSFVELCMHDNPGGHYEMLNKCSCAIDTIAQAVTYDDYVEMSTALNASTIAGERGGLIRDTPAMQDQVKRMRKVLADAKASCMIAPPPPR
jgi:hypothetical protein